jgi:hypothetical protein
MSDTGREGYYQRPSVVYEVTLHPQVIALVGELIMALNANSRSNKNMAGEFDALQQQVHSNTDVVTGAITLINGIADRIAAAGTDPAALQALTTELQNKDQELAAAVAANTPAPPGGGPTVGGGTDTTGGGAGGGTVTGGGAGP